MKYLLLAVLLAIRSNAAWPGDIQPLVFSPPAPNAADEISLLVTAGPCTFFTDGPNDADVVQEGSSIEVVIDGSYSPFQGVCPGEGPDEYAFVLGRFAPGSYLVSITIRDAIFPPPFNLHPSVRTAPLLVVPARRTSTIPAFGPAGLLALVVLVAIACLRRRWGVVLILLFVAAPPRVSANESGVYAVAFLLKLGPGRPTPAEVLENFHLSGGAAPVQSFNSVKPLRALRLIGEPARGDYAAWLNENPDSPEARLDRYLVAVYTAAAQADDALASLRSDDDVLVAYELEAYAASTSTVAAPYWRAAMGTLSPAGVDGWATVGVADTGLSTPHAALADVPGLRRGGFREALPTTSATPRWAVSIAAWTKSKPNPCSRPIRLATRMETDGLLRTLRGTAPTSRG